MKNALHQKFQGIMEQVTLANQNIAIAEQAMRSYAFAAADAECAADGDEQEIRAARAELSRLELELASLSNEVGAASLAATEEAMSTVSEERMYWDAAARFSEKGEKAQAAQARKLAMKARDRHAAAFKTESELAQLSQEIFAELHKLAGETSPAPAAPTTSAADDLPFECAPRSAAVNPEHLFWDQFEAVCQMNLNRLTAAYERDRRVDVFSELALAPTALSDKFAAFYTELEQRQEADENGLATVLREQLEGFLRDEGVISDAPRRNHGRVMPCAPWLA